MYKPLTYSSGIFVRVRDGSVFLLFAFLNNQLGFLPRLLEQSQSLWGHFCTLSVFNRDFFLYLGRQKNDVLGELHFKAIVETIKITGAFPTYGGFPKKVDTLLRYGDLYLVRKQLFEVLGI